MRQSSPRPGGRAEGGPSQRRDQTVVLAVGLGGGSVAVGVAGTSVDVMVTDIWDVSVGVGACVESVGGGVPVVVPVGVGVGVGVGVPVGVGVGVPESVGEGAGVGVGEGDGAGCGELSPPPITGPPPWTTRAPARTVPVAPPAGVVASAAGVEVGVEGWVGTIIGAASRVDTVRGSAAGDSGAEGAPPPTAARTIASPDPEMAVAIMARNATRRPGSSRRCDRISRSPLPGSTNVSANARSSMSASSTADRTTSSSAFGCNGTPGEVGASSALRDVESVPSAPGHVAPPPATPGHVGVSSVSGHVVSAPALDQLWSAGGGQDESLAGGQVESSAGGQVESSAALGHCGPSAGDPDSTDRVIL